MLEEMSRDLQYWIFCFCPKFCKNQADTLVDRVLGVMHGGGGILLQIRQWTECLVWCMTVVGYCFLATPADTLVRVGRQLEQAAAICQHIGCSVFIPAESCPLFIPTTQRMPIDFISLLNDSLVSKHFKPPIGYIIIFASVSQFYVSLTCLA